MADIVVVGGANIDIKAKTLEPHRLGTSNPSVISVSPGGVGRNIAHNLARLGASVSLLSAVGTDADGDRVLAATRDAGVDVSLVSRLDERTGTYLALLDRDGELVSAMSDMRIVEALTPEMVSHHVNALDAAQLIVADCNLPLPTLQMLAENFGDRLIAEPVSVPKSEKLRHVMRSQRIFLATPNFDQLDHLAGTRDIVEAFAWLHANGLDNAVIHAGAEGVFTSDGESIEHIEPIPAGPMLDVTGAGDAAVAGLVYGLLRGEPLHVAASRGQVQAGRVIATKRSTLE